MDFSLIGPQRGGFMISFKGRQPKSVGANLLKFFETP